MAEAKISANRVPIGAILSSREALDNDTIGAFLVLIGEETHE